MAKQTGKKCEFYNMCGIADADNTICSNPKDSDYDQCGKARELRQAKRMKANGR